MNKTKQIASCLMLSFGMMIAQPVLAADTVTAVTETKPNTYTLAQIQNLAVQKNATKKQLDLQWKLLEENRMTIANSISGIDDSIYAMANSGADMGGSGSAEGEQIRALISALQREDPDGKNPSTQAQIMLLQGQLAQIEGAASSMVSSLQSSIDSLQSSKESLETNLTTVKNNQKDLERSKEELDTQMRYLATNLVLQALEMEQNIKLLEKNYELALKMEELEKLKSSLGMSVELDISTKMLEASQVASKLQQAQDGLTVIKRQINDLIGRPLNAELNVAPVELTTNITPAPLYSQKLVDEITKNNYKIKTLNRDIGDYRTEAENLRSHGNSDSNKYNVIDRNIDLKNLEIQTSKTTIANNVKNQLDKIDSTGRAYKEAQINYDKEKKNYEYTKQRYDLGMISPLEFESAELALLQAEIQNMTAGYEHYLANEQFKAMQKGITLSGN